MKLVAALLLCWSGIACAGWSYEPYTDTNGVSGFKVMHNGVEQYDQAPLYQREMVIGYSPVDINDSGWLVGNAYVLDAPSYVNERGWDALMFAMNPSGGMSVGPWTGAAHWLTEDGYACTQGVHGFQMMNVENGESFAIKNCSWTPVTAEDLALPPDMAVAEPGILALLACFGVVGVRKYRRCS